MKNNRFQSQNGLSQQRQSRIIKMKPQKDLFDLFRESKHKLEEAPNPQTWRRLEKRLDTRRVARGSSLYRIMGMAAGVLLLLGVFSLLPVLDQISKKEKIVAMDTPPSEMEDLVVDPNTNHDIIKVVEFSRQYQDRMVQPIEEGSSTKKLVPSKLIRVDEAKKVKEMPVPEDTISKVKG